MKALILAAGLGNRLEGLTLDRPKALVPVAGAELIRWVLNFLDHPLITQIGIVTGYRADVLTSFMKKHRPDVAFFHNENFKLGSILTIRAAMSFLDQDFLLLNTDHIYPKKMWPVIESKLHGITAVCDFDRKLGGDDMKVKLDKNKKLAAIKKTLSDYDCGYIGMTYCGSETLKPYQSAITKTIKIHGESAPVEFILGQLADEGEVVGVCDASGLRWAEVDTLQDLHDAESMIAKNSYFLL